MNSHGVNWWLQACAVVCIVVTASTLVQGGCAHQDYKGFHFPMDQLLLYLNPVNTPTQPYTEPKPDTPHNNAQNWEINPPNPIPKTPLEEEQRDANLFEDLNPQGTNDIDSELGPDNIRQNEHEQEFNNFPGYSYFFPISTGSDETQTPNSVFPIHESVNGYVPNTPTSNSEPWGVDTNLKPPQIQTIKPSLPNSKCKFSKQNKQKCKPKKVSPVEQVSYINPFISSGSPPTIMPKIPSYHQNPSTMYEDQPQILSQHPVLSQPMQTHPYGFQIIHNHGYDPKLSYPANIIYAIKATPQQYFGRIPKNPSKGKNINLTSSPPGTSMDDEDCECAKQMKKRKRPKKKNHFSSMGIESNLGHVLDSPSSQFSNGWDNVEYFGPSSSKESTNLIGLNEPVGDKMESTNDSDENDVDTEQSDETSEENVDNSSDNDDNDGDIDDDDNDDDDDDNDAVENDGDDVENDNDSDENNLEIYNDENDDDTEEVFGEVNDDKISRGMKSKKLKGSKFKKTNKNVKGKPGKMANKKSKPAKSNKSQVQKIKSIADKYHNKKQSLKKTNKPRSKSRKNHKNKVDDEDSFDDLDDDSDENDGNTDEDNDYKSDEEDDTEEDLKYSKNKPKRGKNNDSPKSKTKIKTKESPKSGSDKGGKSKKGTEKDKDSSEERSEERKPKKIDKQTVKHIRDKLGIKDKGESGSKPKSKKTEKETLTEQNQNNGDNNDVKEESNNEEVTESDKADDDEVSENQNDDEQKSEKNSKGKSGKAKQKTDGEDQTNGDQVTENNDEDGGNNEQNKQESEKMEEDNDEDGKESETPEDSGSSMLHIQRSDRGRRKEGKEAKHSRKKRTLDNGRRFHQKGSRRKRSSYKNVENIMDQQGGILRSQQKSPKVVIPEQSVPDMFHAPDARDLPIDDDFMDFEFEFRNAQSRLATRSAISTEVPTSRKQSASYESKNLNMSDINLKLDKTEGPISTVYNIAVNVLVDSVKYAFEKLFNQLAAMMKGQEKPKA